MTPSPADGRPGGEQTIYLMQQARWQLDRLWTMERWTYELLIERLALILPSRKHVDAVMGAVQRYMDEGGSLSNVEWRRRFKRIVYGMFNETLTATNLDPMSRAAAMVPSDPNKAAMQFDWFSSRFYLAPFLKDGLPSSGRFGYISGPDYGGALGVGKTDTGMLMAEMDLDLGFDAAVNVLYEGEVPGMVEVLTLKDLVKTSILNLTRHDDPETGRGPRFTNATLDGSPQFIRRERQTSHGNVQLNQVLYLCRKIGLNIKFISQKEEKIPDDILHMAMWHIQKEEPTVMNFEPFDSGQRYRIVNVPPTSVRYLTGDFETFESEFDIEGMHNMLTKLPKKERLGEGQLQAILDFLDRDSQTLTKGDKRSAAKVLFINSGGEASYTEIGRSIGESRQTVTNWLREMDLIEED